MGRRPVGNGPSEVSSPISLHPRDTELLHPGCPVGPDVGGLPGPVLHPFLVCPRPRPPGLNHLSLCCRYSGTGLGIAWESLQRPEPSLSAPCAQLSPWWWPWQCTQERGGPSLNTPKSRPSSPGPSTWAGSQLSSGFVQVITRAWGAGEGTARHSEGARQEEVLNPLWPPQVP